jgi:replicative DNA helicase
LFNAFGDMLKAGKPLDQITLIQFLKDRNQLEALGGAPYIFGLMNCAASPAHLERYTEIVREKFILRKVIQLCAVITGKAYEWPGKVAEIVNELQKAAMGIEPEAKGCEEINASELMRRVQERLESYGDQQSKAKGVMTGFWELDRILGGFKVGQLIILGARPSIGKSSLAMNLVEQIAIVAKEPCAFFSMEMEAEELGERLVSAQAGIDGARIQEYDLSGDEFTSLTRAMGRISNAPIYIYDRGGLSFEFFRAKLRKMAVDHKIRLAIIDYLQLFDLPTNENRSVEIGNITKGLKSLAKELKMTIVCLSQLNRDLEKDNRRPRLSDLRDSGGIEQDADKVILLSEEIHQKQPKKKAKAKSKSASGKLFEKENAPEPDEPEIEYDSNKPIIIADVAKNRGGKKGFARLLFNKPLTRFENVQMESGI